MNNTLDKKREARKSKVGTFAVRENEENDKLFDEIALRYLYSERGWTSQMELLGLEVMLEKHAGQMRFFVAQFFEECLSVVGGLKRLPKGHCGQDFDDQSKSDARTIKLRWNNKDHYNYKGSCSIRNKVGMLRIMTINPYTREISLYLIPHWWYSRLVNKKGKKRYSFNIITHQKRKTIEQKMIEDFRVKTFKEVAADIIIPEPYVTGLDV